MSDFGWKVDGLRICEDFKHSKTAGIEEGQ